MTLAQLLNRTVWIVRRSASGEVDDYGNPTMTDDSVETVCEVQQVSAVEPDDQGDLSDEDWVGFFLPTETVGSGDALIFDGEAYEVVGDPWRARNPRTREFSHIRAKLRRTAGPEDVS